MKQLQVKEELMCDINEESLLSTVGNKKSQERFQLSHQLLGWTNSKIWIVHLLSVKT